METNEEFKNRIKDRIKYLILHPSGVFRSRILKERAYKLGVEYTDNYMPMVVIESILQLEDGEEKEKKFDQLCEKIVTNLVVYKQFIEANATIGEDWHPKMEINNFLSFRN